MDKNLKYKMVEKMTMVVDNILECVTIEISMGKEKNVIVSCIYRTPGSNTEIFKEWVDKTFTRTNQKVMFICGDFNINLLNPSKQKMTEEFINTMYSLGLCPMITKPSRITAQSATLIDNIFTNEIENRSISGLLINDISDHLPVFIVYNKNYRKVTQENIVKYKRMRTEESINAFKNDLLKQEWETLYREKNIDKAYEIFLGKFKMLYNSRCSVRKYSKKQKYAECPWITKGLQNACKKKNTLYREFIMNRSIEAENKYKKYKNKLTSILRLCKKEYYEKLLIINKK